MIGHKSRFSKNRCIIPLLFAPCNCASNNQRHNQYHTKLSRINFEPVLSACLLARSCLVLQAVSSTLASPLILVVDIGIRVRLRHRTAISGSTGDRSSTADRSTNRFNRGTLLLLRAVSTCISVSFERRYDLRIVKEGVNERNNKTH